MKINRRLSSWVKLKTVGLCWSDFYVWIARTPTYTLTCTYTYTYTLTRTHPYAPTYTRTLTRTGTAVAILKQNGLESHQITNWNCNTVSTLCTLGSNPGRASPFETAKAEFKVDESIWKFSIVGDSWFKSRHVRTAPWVDYLLDVGYKFDLADRRLGDLVHRD